MHLLWTFLLFMFCVCHAVLYVHCSIVATCWESVGLLALLYLMFSCVIVTYPCVVLGRVWSTIASIPDICLILNYIYHTLASIKIVYFFECYLQSVDIHISIPAISSTTTLVLELTIIRVWLPVKETCIIGTNI